MAINTYGPWKMAYILTTRVPKSCQNFSLNLPTFCLLCSDIRLYHSPLAIQIAVCQSLLPRFSGLAYIFQPMNLLVQFLSRYKTNIITVIIVIIITSAVMHKEYYEILQAGSPSKLFKKKSFLTSQIQIYSSFKQLDNNIQGYICCLFWDS
jgi:hypothetical protein